MKNTVYAFYMKNSQRVFNKLYAQIAYLFKGKSITSNNNRVFLIPPTDGGSLGDEAMIVSAVRHLKNMKKDVYIISSDKELSQKLHLYKLDCAFIYISKLYYGFMAFHSFVKTLKKMEPSSIYLIGADVMDGFYSKTRSLTRLALLDISSSYVKDVRLLGFSMNDEPEPATINYMKKIDNRVVLFSRDPISAERLSNRGIKNKLVADLAFGLTPSYDFDMDNISAKQWVDKYKSSNGYICINLNAIHYNKYGKEYFEKASIVIKRIIELTNKHILFVSHDTRVFKGVTDISFANDVAKRLKLTLNKDYSIAPEFISAENLKYLASESDFLVTGRMHFAIGGLGTGVPALMFGYQGKQEGLAKHFDLPNELLILDPESDLNTMLETTKKFVESIEIIKNSLINNLEKIKSLSRSNFN